MESKKNITTEPNKPSGISQSTPNTPGTTAGQPGQTSPTAASAPQRAREVGSEVYDQTKQAVTNAYDKTTEVLSNTYDQAMTYGRENPGKLTLIAFGAGIGIGLLLAGSLSGGRSRTNRIAEPAIDALSRIAMEFFR